jgi:hypothetical protein
LKCKAKTLARQDTDAKSLHGGKPYVLFSLAKVTVRRYLCQR